MSGLQMIIILSSYFQSELFEDEHYNNHIIFSLYRQQ